MPAGSFVEQMGQSLGMNAASSAGSSVGGGIADALFGGISARRNWKYKQKEMALQQQYALEQMSKSAEFQLAHDKQMFDYQNAYNDPSAVLARNLAAGLNPAAVLGQPNAHALAEHLSTEYPHTQKDYQQEQQDPHQSHWPQDHDRMGPHRLRWV